MANLTTSRFQLSRTAAPGRGHSEVNVLTSQTHEFIMTVITSIPAQNGRHLRSLQTTWIGDSLGHLLGQH